MKPEEICEKLEPVVGGKAKKLLKLYLLEDRKGKGEVEEVINLLRIKKLNEEEILLPPPADASGDYPFGSIVYNKCPSQPFLLRKKELTRHTAIFGTTGAGKTNACLLLIKALLEDNVPFIITDFKKNYRDLIRTEIGKNIRVYTVGRDASPFRFNPLVPPKGVDAQIYINKLIDVINHSHFVSYGVDHLLQSAIHSVYEECGVYSQMQKVPTFKDVQAKLLKYQLSGRESLWKASALRTMQDLTFGPVGRVFDAEETFDVESFLAEPVVLELDALPQTTKTFLAEALLLQIYLYRLNQGKRDEKLRHVLVLEEAHHLLLKRREEKETITDVFLREIRETGQGVCLLDQSPSLISGTALSNTNTLIAMQLKHKDDIYEVSKALLLKDLDCFGMLKVGEAVVKTQEPRPFLVRFPLFSMDKGVVSDDAVRRHMGGKGVVSSYSADSGAIRFSQGDSVENKPFCAGDNVSEDEARFLCDVALHPLSGVSSRYVRLDFSVERGQETKNSLVDRGVLRPTSVPIRTGRLLLLELTEKGRETLARLGVRSRLRPNCGVVHEFWRMKAASYYKGKGYAVREEVPIGSGKAVDLVIEKDGEKTAVEIETGKSDFMENLRKCTGIFDNIICLATSLTAEKRLRERLPKIILTRHNVKITGYEGFR